MICFGDAKQCLLLGDYERTVIALVVTTRVACPQSVFRHYLNLYRNKSVPRDRFCHQITPVLLRYSKPKVEQPANKRAQPVQSSQDNVRYQKSLLTSWLAKITFSPNDLRRIACSQKHKSSYTRINYAWYFLLDFLSSINLYIDISTLAASSRKLRYYDTTIPSPQDRDSKIDRLTINGDIFASPNPE